MFKIIYFLYQNSFELGRQAPATPEQTKEDGKAGMKKISRNCA